MNIDRACCKMLELFEPRAHNMGNNVKFDNNV